MTNLTVVITTYNRGAVLPDLLARFEAQTDKDFEVVVAVDGATDDTEAVLSSLNVSFPLRWVNTHCPDYGLAVARNLGILNARGRIVAILDDDSFPDPGYVAAHAASARPGVITGGPRQPSDPADTRLIWKMEQLHRLPKVTPMTLPELRRNWPNAYLIENNISLLRDDWVAMGLFSERIKLYGFIGQEFFGRAEHLDLRYQFDPSAAIMHHAEFEGDNQFHRSKKARQTALSGLLRPALMRPHQYAAQINWAKAIADGDTPREFPPYWPAVIASLSGRGARRGLRSLGLSR